MATFTGTATSFNSTTRIIPNEEVALITGQLRCHLYDQSTNPPVVTKENLSETTPLSGGGYPGAVALTGNVVENISGKTHRFTANPIVFTAGVGGILNAYWWAIYDAANVNDKLIAFGQLDNTNNPVSAAEGDSITINPHPTDGFIRFPTST